MTEASECPSLTRLVPARFLSLATCTQCKTGILSHSMLSLGPPQSPRKHARQPAPYRHQQVPGPSLFICIMATLIHGSRRELLLFCQDHTQPHDRLRSDDSLLRFPHTSFRDLSVGSESLEASWLLAVFSKTMRVVACSPPGLCLDLRRAGPRCHKVNMREGQCVWGVCACVRMCVRVCVVNS